MRPAGNRLLKAFDEIRIFWIVLVISYHYNALSITKNATYWIKTPINRK